MSDDGSSNVLQVITQELKPFWDAAKLPVVIAANATKAIDQISAAVTRNIVARIDGNTAKVKAYADVGVSHVHRTGDVIEEDITVPKEYGRLVAEQHARRIIREQKNLDEVARVAVEDLTHGEQIEQDAAADISSDWLNQFEDRARLMSSEGMRATFAKILSGEIKKPGSFSVRTLQCLATIEGKIAKLFQQFCSCAISISYQNGIDGRVPIFAGHPNDNVLEAYGLSFDHLNELQEYGLIITQYESTLDYSFQIISNLFSSPLRFRIANFF